MICRVLYFETLKIIVIPRKRLIKQFRASPQVDAGKYRKVCERTAEKTISTLGRLHIRLSTEMAVLKMKNAAYCGARCFCSGAKPVALNCPTHPERSRKKIVQAKDPAKGTRSI